MRKHQRNKRSDSSFRTSSPAVCIATTQQISYVYFEKPQMLIKWAYAAFGFPASLLFLEYPTIPVVFPGTALLCLTNRET